MRWLLALLLSVVASAAAADDSLPGLAGGETGDRILFVGDSLTLGVGISNPRKNMPEDVSNLFGDPGRRFKVLAVQGAVASAMRYAFLREPLEPTDVAVIWLGRNGTADPATVPSIKDIAARVPSGRYLVLSILPRVYFEYEAPGTRAFQNLVALNDELAATFADRFLPVGGDIGPADHSDEMHLNTRGYAKVARIVYDALVARGW